ncbi:MAG: class I SAM-dependent methyltransferase [Chloroflexi bacterium]|nr:class I SAM-dependent methyltransferase [Chloroflexota bacterium]
MDIRFETDHDRNIYLRWTHALLPVFKERMMLHFDLYEATHLHRIEHNEAYGEGICSAWPSPPYQAPMWPVIAALISPRSFLELGCALGYNLALMASAGATESTVDGIETDASHAALAEEAIARKGLAKRVRVFRGDSNDILPDLPGPYDVIFVDGGCYENMWDHLKRLTREGGVVVDKAPLRHEVEKLVKLVEMRAGKGDEEVERVHAEVRRRYEAAVREGMVVL